LVGKNININLMTLMRHPRRQNINVKLKVKSVSEKNALTELFSYELSSSYVKRMARKGKSKIDDSFVVESKDKVRMRVKPLVIARNKVQRSVSSAVKRELREILKKEIEEKTFTEFILAVIDSRLQKEIKKKLSKVYPIGMLELRTIKRL